MAEYPSSMGDGKSIEDKRPSNPPPSNSSREGIPGTDGIVTTILCIAASTSAHLALKTGKTSKGTGALGESDFEGGEERKGYHGDQDLSRR